MRARVQVLGSVAVSVDGELQAVSSRSQRVVLSVLAARANQEVSADLLVDALWGGSPPRTAVSSLRTYVSRLRALLGEALVGLPGAYRLSIDGQDLDLLRFEGLLDRTSTAQPAEALDLLDEAIGIWQGPPFGDVGDLEAIRATTARLQERWETAREVRVRSLLACGRDADAAAAAEELLVDHPLREGAWVALVEALTATGRPTEALRAYQRASEALADAGLEPSAPLRRAETAALAGEVDAPVRRSVVLPASSFVGRDHDRERLVRLTASRPVVTLVGPGGVGKSRLARVVAADAERRFAGGARFIELAGLDDATQVAAVVADELGLTVGPEGPQHALAAATALDVLVVVDNCEHVVDAVAEVVARLSAGGGRLRIIATSREPLAVDGEQLWPVHPLPVHGTGDAVQLFVDRLQSVRPDLRPADDELRLIAEIVQRVDGLPLAVEMAAAAAATMPLLVLRERLDGELDLPALRRRDLDERHQTMKALLDWSLRLLDDEERTTFARLAVFAGPVTADDVSQVTGEEATADVLDRLVRRSLVQVDTTGDEARFTMLRTVRQRAAEAAGDQLGALRQRHATWLVEAVTAADRQLRIPDEGEAHDRLERLLDDARVAMAWAREHDPALAVRLAARLLLFGQSRLRDEVLAWSSELVDQLGEELAGPDGELVLTAAAHRAASAGDLERARRLAERAVVLDDGVPDPLVYEVLSDLNLFAGRTEAAREAAQAGLSIAAEGDDAHATVVCLVGLVLADSYAGDHDAAARTMQAFTEPPELAPSDRAWLEYVEGERLLDLDPAAALASLHRAAAIADGVGNGYVGAVARVSYASVLSRAGDPADARQPFAELIAHWRRHGDQTHLLTTLRNLVPVLDRLHLPERCAELLGAVLGETVSPTFGSERSMLEGVRDHLERTLGRPALDRRLAEGRERSIDDAARLAQRWLEESIALGP